MNNTDNADTPANGVSPQGNLSGLVDVLRIPVIEEQVQIEKQLVETGRLLINKAVREEERVVTTPLVHEELSVERVPVNQYVDVAPAIRYEGDVTIVPVVKEVVVVETRLVLVEEVRITKRQITTIDTQQVTLRQEEVTVERIDNEADVRSDGRPSL
ncbi:YsnF/AvaK domain-containing protein [Spirosoma utsteinense]|uniref:DUF2382 domain-containing protein n=1 Tax=Spirosoma utsteinense TaxID=2585773 RepID=A0ABR6W9P5_9BACT|nr:YsnF/AvaK domain-containing protein [Spirosoma utsteinense]MBC3786761.1 putative protein (TIGR02271 family) [Spirosoma utsteinense]MBC3793296.1 putative protein (TIGR02271 family) [Spirosoma utsteinense]